MPEQPDECPWCSPLESLGPGRCCSALRSHLNRDRHEDRHGRSGAQTVAVQQVRVLSQTRWLEPPFLDHGEYSAVHILTNPTKHTTLGHPAGGIDPNLDNRRAPL